MRGTERSAGFGIFKGVTDTPPGALPVPVVPGLTDLQVFARGGYATVYRATQISVGREVAVKVENRTLESERDQRRFLREARAAGRMSSHPHVVDLFDAGVTEDQHPYLIMELCDGSYAERMRTSPLGAAEARDVGVKIADALADAHQLGVLHRDVKPANILYSRFNEPALADFGLAVLAEARDSMVTLEVLTPAYAPPEMFRHSPPSPAVDVYALCATLYAVMHGKPPRWRAERNPGLLALMELFAEPIPELPGVPTSLVDILRYGMSNEPGDRPSAEELRDLLRDVSLDPPDATARPPSVVPVSGASSTVPVAEAPTAAAPAATAPSAGAPAAPGVGTPISGGPAAPGAAIPAGSTPGVYRSGASYVPPPPRPTGPAPRPPYAPHDEADPTVPIPQRRRRLAWFLGGLGALALLATVATTSWYLLSQGVPGPKPSGVARSVAASSSPSRTGAGGAGALRGCLAVLPSAARCPGELECFGPVRISGTRATAERLPCTGRHTWEGYAEGDLPADVDAADHEAVRDAPVVRQVCNPSVFRLTTMFLDIADWRFEVLPPADSDGQTDRTFRCLAGKGANGLTGPTLSAG